MKRLGPTAVLIAIAATTIAGVRTADACSSSCWLGAFVPAEGATVPANLPALVWAPTYADGQPDLAQVVLTREDGGPTAISFTATPQPAGYYLLVPSEPLVAGATYELVDNSQCFMGAGPRATFTVGPAAPLPTRLGTLTATPEPQARATLATGAGSCSVEADIARVAITLAYDAEASPWRDVLHLETRVDGDPWHPQTSILTPPPPGASWIGRGSDRIYSVCVNHGTFGEPSLDLPQGGHEVSMRASLPGTTLALQSDVVPAFLHCEAALPDGGLSHDGSPAPDAGTGWNVHGGDGGCAASRAGTTAWLGLALAALLGRRRRTRRRS